MDRARQVVVCDFEPTQSHNERNSIAIAKSEYRQCSQGLADAATCCSRDTKCLSTFLPFPIRRLLVPTVSRLCKLASLDPTCRVVLSGTKLRRIMFTIIQDMTPPFLVALMAVPHLASTCAEHESLKELRSICTGANSCATGLITGLSIDCKQPFPGPKSAASKLASLSSVLHACHLRRFCVVLHLENHGERQSLRTRCYVPNHSRSQSSCRNASPARHSGT